MTESRFRALAVLTKVPNADQAADRPCMVLVRFPAANKSAEALVLNETELPALLRQRLEDGRVHGYSVRAHCVVNLAAERSKDLEPSDWEST
jgi:hypothetical protein